jgi:hypothetical protein
MGQGYYISVLQISALNLAGNLQARKILRRSAENFPSFPQRMDFIQGNILTLYEPLFRAHTVRVYLADTLQLL